MGFSRIFIHGVGRFSAFLQKNSPRLTASEREEGANTSFEVEGTRSQSPMCLPVAMGNPLATHTEASTTLITAHQAHHCDDHPRSQTRDYF